MFPNASIQNMEYNHSDHRPLCLDIDYFGGSTGGHNAKVKRFEARWLREETFDAIVREAWEKVEVDPIAHGIYEKLNKMHVEFHNWD